MINKPLKDVIKSDILEFVENSVSESKTLEFKKELNLSNDKDKREFLADFSAFANTSGGDLLFGVEERDSIAVSIPGISITNETITQIENILRTNLAPRFTGYQIQPVDLENSNIVLIIRIAKSWNSPHRVTFRGHDKFFARNSNGKYDMDVNELRSAFNLSSTITEKIQGFLIDRVIKIENNDIPTELSKEEAKLVLHLIPASSMVMGHTHDLSNIKDQYQNLKGISCSVQNAYFNLDGYLTFSFENKCYVQTFKSGIIESVQCGISTTQTEQPKIPSMIIEGDLIDVYDNYMEVLKSLNVGLPIYCFVTFIGVKNHGLAVGGFSQRNIVYNKSILRLTDSIVNDFNDSSSKVFKPIFDSMWNAFGHPRSENFNTDGEWIGRT